MTEGTDNGASLPGQREGPQPCRTAPGRTRHRRPRLSPAGSAAGGGGSDPRPPPRAPGGAGAGFGGAALIPAGSGAARQLRTRRAPSAAAAVAAQRFTKIKFKILSKPPPFYAKGKCGARAGSPRAPRTGAAGTGSVLPRLPRFSFYFPLPRRYRRAELGCSQRGRGSELLGRGKSQNRFILTLLFAIFAQRSFRDSGATLRPPLERYALKNKRKRNQT